MKITNESTLRLLLVGLAGTTACAAGDPGGELTVSRSDDAALVGQYDSAAGPRLELEVLAGEHGATARVRGPEEGALLRVERDDDGEPIVWVGAVPLAEAADDAAPAELIRVLETDEWAAVPELVQAIEEIDAPQALVRPLREGVDLVTGGTFEAPDIEPPRTQEYSGIRTIYGCMSWYQARSVANSRCSFSGYSYANFVGSWAWTRCGTDSYGNTLYGTFEYQCYRGSAW
ncbi:MAG TPA: hypothetical protein VMZ28_07790 [Kofleriaceae bacterium]|nr:hypothetical protein [Kofleriaceae bacterium]